MKVIICDRCGKKVKPEEAKRVSVNVSHETPFTFQFASNVKDVCEDCHRRIEKFINEPDMAKCGDPEKSMGDIEAERAKTKHNNSFDEPELCPTCDGYLNHCGCGYKTYDDPGHPDYDPNAGCE